MEGSQQLEITEFEVPPVIKVNENVTLKCRYSGSEDVIVKWLWTPLHAGADLKKTLYQRIGANKPTTKKHSHVSIKEDDSIELTEVQPINSGTYVCEISSDSELLEVREQQEVIVFTEGTGPQLNISTLADGPDEDDEEDVSVVCEAQGVSPLPELSITLNNVEVNITEVVDGLTDEFYDIVANATLSKADAEGATIECELFFKTNNFSHVPFRNTMYYDALSDALTTTEASEITSTTEEATTLPNTPDKSSRVDYSWPLFFAIVVYSLL